MKKNILDILDTEDSKNSLLKHPLLLELSSKDFRFGQLEPVISQWYHPLHYFPTFLARLIAIAPTLKPKTILSKILWQELGEGNPERAHEFIFFKTMSSVGFSERKILDAHMLPSTFNLIEKFRKSTEESYLKALGVVFGTEAADLVMVSSIGRAIKKLTNQRTLEWVDIHICQEPDHTDSVESALTEEFNDEEKEIVIKAAKEIWGAWVQFFNGIDMQVKAA